MSGEHSQRPWGSYTVLDESAVHKVKRIDVQPGRRLSYERHQRRAEHWFMVAGSAEVTVDGVVRRLEPGDAIDYPHRGGPPHRQHWPRRRSCSSRFKTVTTSARTTSNASRMTLGAPADFPRHASLGASEPYRHRRGGKEMTP